MGVTARSEHRAHRNDRCTGLYSVSASTVSAEKASCGSVSGASATGLPEQAPSGHQSEGSVRFCANQPFTLLQMCRCLQSILD
jgi:hypothetical protein